MDGLASEVLFDVTADLKPAKDIGARRYGTRRVIYVKPALSARHYPRVTQQLDRAC